MPQQFANKILSIQQVSTIKPNFSLLLKLSKEQAKDAETIIFDGDAYTVQLLTTNSFPDKKQEIIQQIESQQKKTDIYYIDDESFAKALERYDQYELGQQEQLAEKTKKENAKDVDAEVLIKEMYANKSTYDEWGFIIWLIKLAFQAGASDLHFQQEAEGVLMRLRKDGLLKNLLVFSHAEFQKYFTKIKFISGVKMNIDYKPQDGRFDFEVRQNGATKKIDVRVNFMPGLRWESIVMRFLDAETGLMGFSQIGFEDFAVKIIEQNLQKTYGMILLTGPTGSWKTTTLYSMLNALNHGNKKIITIEDPVEYEIPGIQQSQINLSKGYSYEEWLKSVLRHDPDVIMIWEIRTLESAEIAINAALTGHLVFSTLHTNTAVEAINRLLNMGVKDYMLSSALNLVISQRLVRRVHTCAKKENANPADTITINQAISEIKTINPALTLPEFNGQIDVAVGCEGCMHDGYKGRVAVSELLEISPRIRQSILDHKSAKEILEAAQSEWFITLHQDGIAKVLEWQTTIDEIRENVG